MSTALLIAVFMTVAFIAALMTSTTTCEASAAPESRRKNLKGDKR